MNDFEFLVNISPDNHKKWEEMMADKESQKLLLNIYKILVESASQSSNSIIENTYASFKEGRLEEHHKIWKELFIKSG